MQMVRKLILIAIGSCAGIGAFAQGTFCSTSSPTRTRLVCLVPFTTDASQPGLSGVGTNDLLASAFNGPIAAQLSQLPVATSAPVATTIFTNGNPENYPNLGPILLDRPDSVRTGTLVLGFSFQHFNFNHLDGISVGSIPVVFSENPSGANQYQYLAESEAVSLQLNQYVALATLGLPKKTDISLIMPFSKVTINGSSSNPTNYFVSYGTPGNPGGVVTSSSLASSTSLVPGSASGIGDVTVNVKHVLWSGGETGRGSLATGVAVRFPSGDAFNYLGSGAYGFNLYALASYKYWISPHVKFGYQFNTNTRLLNLDNTPGGNRALPGGSQFALGADVNIPKLHDKVTGSMDVLANEFVNSPYILQSPVALGTTGKSVQGLTVSTPGTTYTTANLSFGLKLRPVKTLILYGNVLFQANNVGLRPDPSPSFGISYSFPGKLSGKNLHKVLDR